MESGAVETTDLGRPPGRWGFNRRFMGIALVTEAVVVFLAYMVVNVPVMGPKLTEAEVNQHWVAAVVGATAVALGVLMVVALTLQERRLFPIAPEKAGSETAADRPRVPRSLRFEHVPGRIVAIAAVASVLALVSAVALGLPGWAGWLVVMAPWVPLVALESRWKFAVYGIFAGFLLVVVMQLLHMVEHSTQVGQLLYTDGDLARSHGIIGQFDFELVHFVTDTVLWVTLGLLVVMLRGRNPWLWVAFAAASLHQVEHFYLFYIYHADNAFYLSGGFAGIMGENGLIGSPLDRPYLHYTYNFIVFLPMVLAVWDWARSEDRRVPRPS